MSWGSCYDLLGFSMPDTSTPPPYCLSNTKFKIKPSVYHYQSNSKHHHLSLSLIPLSTHVQLICDHMTQDCQKCISLFWCIIVSLYPPPPPPTLNIFCKYSNKSYTDTFSVKFVYTLIPNRDNFKNGHKLTQKLHHSISFWYPLWNKTRPTMLSGSYTSMADTGASTNREHGYTHLYTQRPHSQHSNWPTLQH